MLDHVSITVSDLAAAERFYDAIMQALGVVKVGRREDWLGYGERARAAYPDRVRTGCTSRSTRIRNRRTARAAIGASRRSGEPRSMRSGTPALRPAAPTMARPDCAITTRPITPRSCATSMATASRPFAITRSEIMGYRFAPPTLSSGAHSRDPVAGNDEVGSKGATKQHDGQISKTCQARF